MVTLFCSPPPPPHVIAMDSEKTNVSFLNAELTTQPKIPNTTRTLTSDLSHTASTYSGILFPLCTKVPTFVGLTPISLLLRSTVCGRHAKERSGMLKGRTACELNVFVFATNKAERARFCYLTRR